MKKKEKQTLHAMNGTELDRVLADAQTALRHLTIGRHTRQIRNVREGRNLRKKIAIVKTFRKEKEQTHE